MLERPRKVRLARERLESPGPGEVLLRADLSTFKHGTEMMGYLGRSPFVRQVFDSGLRLFEPAPRKARFYPRALGNMVVGTVEAAGAEVSTLRPGERAFAWAPVADRHVLPVERVQPLAGLAPEQALCLDPASFALGAVMDGAIAAGETVLVTGLGAIGLFVVQYARLAGARVIAASRLAARRRLATACGAEAIYDPGAVGDLGRIIKERHGGAHAAIECSGQFATLQAAMRAVRQCGRVVCVGFYPPGRLDLGTEFFHNRLSLLASLPALSWNNPVRGAEPLRAPDLQQRAAADFRAGRIGVHGILQPTVPFERAAAAVRLIAERPDRVVKVLVTHAPSPRGKVRAAALSRVASRARARSSS